VPALRQALEESGFFEVLASEDENGAGLEMRQFYPIVALCGATAVPLPLPQTMVARLLVPPQHIPQGTITIAPALAESANDEIICRLVPFAKTADHVLAIRGSELILLPVASATMLPGGVPRSLTASLTWQRGCGRCVAPAASVDLQALGALLHAGLIAGAAKRVFDMTLQYANERTQFGRSIGKFQAIQHQLSVMAEYVAVIAIAAEAAFQTGRRLPSVLACAVAKSRASEAAQLVAATAHSVHGAIGITAEFELQLYTRRLHEWRMAHGSEVYWNSILGNNVLASGHALITDFVRGVIA